MLCRVSWKVELHRLRKSCTSHRNPAARHETSTLLPPTCSGILIFLFSFFLFLVLGTRLAVFRYKNMTLKFVCDGVEDHCCFHTHVSDTTSGNTALQMNNHCAVKSQEQRLARSNNAAITGTVLQTHGKQSMPLGSVERAHTTLDTRVGLLEYGAGRLEKCWR